VEDTGINPELAPKRQQMKWPEEPPAQPERPEPPSMEDLGARITEGLFPGAQPAPARQSSQQAANAAAYAPRPPAYQSHSAAKTHAQMTRRQR
jgi:hypothetical protein